MRPAVSTPFLDRLAAFALGLAASLPGALVAVVAIFLWARHGPLALRDQRESHAQGVGLCGAAGLLASDILLASLLVLLAPGR